MWVRLSWAFKKGRGSPRWKDAHSRGRTGATATETQKAVQRTPSQLTRLEQSALGRERRIRVHGRQERKDNYSGNLIGKCLQLTQKIKTPFGEWVSKEHRALVV